MSSEQVERVGSDSIPATSQCPGTPPPSLMTDVKSTVSSAKSYTRDLLLSLAFHNATPPAPDRLQSFSELIRNDSGQWGIDEEHSSIFDGQPVSKSRPIPKQAELIGAEGNGHPADILFNYSTPGDRAAPVMIDFNNPDPFAKAVSGRKASTAFQGFPGSSNSSTASIDRSHLANSMGEKFGSLRIGTRTSSISGSASPAFSTESDSSLQTRSGSPSRFNPLCESPGLNPFAAPFPLPDNTPKLIITSSSTQGTSCPTPTPSLPMPRTLPSSLPPKPNVGLPPVFVKRESAALPQPMSLPDIAPLGQDWEGEQSLSGNDKRRRASEFGLPPIPLASDKLHSSGRGGSLGSKGIETRDEKRPERLVKLGKSLRESVSAQGRGKTMTRA